MRDALYDAYRFRYLAGDAALARRVILAWQIPMLAFSGIDYWLFPAGGDWLLLLATRLAFCALALFAWYALRTPMLTPELADSLTLAWNLALAEFMLYLAGVYGDIHPAPEAQHILVLLSIYLMMPAARPCRVFPALLYTLGVIVLHGGAWDLFALSIHGPSLALANLLGYWLSMRLNEDRVDEFLLRKHSDGRIRDLERIVGGRAARSGMVDKVGPRRLSDRLSADGVARTVLAILRLDVGHVNAHGSRLDPESRAAAMRQVGLRVALGIRQDDTLSRVGESGYVVMLHGLDQDTAARIGDRLLRLCNGESASGENGAALPYSVSIGLAGGDTREVDAATLIERAEYALNLAKIGPGGRCVIYSLID